MKIKTYQALTMQEALKQIKAELGPDAVIMSTRQVRATSGTLALLGRQLVEVTAAIDVTPLTKKKAATTPQPDPSADQTFEATLQSRLASTEFARLADDSPDSPIVPVWEEMREELVRMRDVMERMMKVEATRPNPGVHLLRNVDLVVQDSGTENEPAASSGPLLPNSQGSMQGSAAWVERMPHRLAVLYYDLVSKGLAVEYAKTIISSLSTAARPST